jgi:hypothetical protein
MDRNDIFLAVLHDPRAVVGHRRGRMKRAEQHSEQQQGWNNITFTDNGREWRHTSCSFAANRSSLGLSIFKPASDGLNEQHKRG